MKKSLFRFQISFLLLGSFCFSLNAQDKKTTSIHEPSIVHMIEVDSIWAANGVRFDLQTVGQQQFIVYYDRNRMMTVASRALGSKDWAKKTLPNRLIWDSHNSVKLGIDEMGYIHVSGNQHVDPLAYFRSTKPYDVSSMIELNTMLGQDEESVTYPNFFNDKNGRLLFSYRSGTCGNGNILINRFDPKSQKWERYLEKPLFEGIEKNDDRAAYHHWVKDSKGNFHFAWMWRWTPKVETSHHIGYATTSDLQHWKNAQGREVSLPFRPNDASVMVDNTPTKGGLHNSRYKLFLTDKDEPIIGYIKYDEGGNTQLYLSMLKNNRWVSKQISDWNFRWEFIDGGAFMTIGGKFSFVGMSEDGLVAIDWANETGDSGQYIIDLNTFDHADKNATIKKMYPPNLGEKIGSNEKMRVRLTYDKGASTDSEYNYVLKWEAEHGGFRQHAPEVIPEGPLSPLYLVEIK